MRYPILDLLRYLAAMMVAIAHFQLEIGTKIYSEMKEIPILKFLIDNGGKGVEIFFIISGFVIIESARNKSASQFIALRFIRLFPGLFVSMVAVLIVGNIFISPYEQPILSFLNSIFLTYKLTNIQPLATPLWTLIFEVLFYLGVGLLIYLRPEIFKNDTSIVIAVCIWQFPSFIAKACNFDTTYLNVISLGGVGPFFSIGILLNTLRHSLEKTDSNTLSWIISFLILIFSYQALFVLHQYSAGVNALLLFCIFIIFASSRLAFHSNLFNVLGLASYIIYLTHEHLGLSFWLMFRKYITTNELVIFIFTLLFITTLGIFIAIFIEKPLQRLMKKYLTQKLEI